jgi:predicted metalloprotease
MLRHASESPEVAVAAVCAHEFGHIVQYRHDLIDKVQAGQPTVKRTELQADYFAGYFAGRRKLERSTFPTSVVALTIHRLGDTEFSNPGHHGTPQERGWAVTQGFEAASGGKSLSEAIEESTRYVLTQ